MKACTFFGNHDTPHEVQMRLCAAILDLIENHGVKLFYVGTHGNFDKMARRQLSELEESHGIRFFVVLAYYPKSKEAFAEDKHTVFPEGMETVPPRFAIIRRNMWMLEHCDYVITNIQNQTGGAGRFKLLAERKGKTIVELYSDDSASPN